MSVDPEHEKTPGVRPYAYALNNPLKFLDADGRYARGTSLNSNMHNFGDRGGAFLEFEGAGGDTIAS